MRRFYLVICAILISGLAASVAQAYPRGGFSVGINLGGPYYGRPWGYYPYYGYPYGWGYARPYYYPAPVIYEAAPVVVQPAPVVVRPGSALVPATSYTSSAAYAAGGGQTGLERHLQMLRAPEEAVRRDAAMEMGRMKAEGAVDPLTAALAGDQSPVVRDAAARALGLIGSPRSLTALIRAAQADSDRDVRHSAQFAVEIIRTNLKN